MATSFSTDIRPYFTACYRAHMIEFGGFDLWSQADVQANFDGILSRVSDGSMPIPAGQDGACPEGGWDVLTRNQFTADFQSWKDGAFQP